MLGLVIFVESPMARSRSSLLFVLVGLLGVVHTADAYDHHSDHMWGGWGYGHGFGWLFMLILIVALVGVVIFTAVRTGRGHSPSVGGSRPGPQQTALDILDERLARGEIDLEDYEKRREVLAKRR
jgi:putative membrane protein